mgnify:CR=1 FL=1
MKPVANLQPRLANLQGLKLAIVGEAPGQDEATMGLPFIGTGGRLLSAILSQNGLGRDQVFLGNICQTLPPGGDIDKLDFYGTQIQDGLAQLTTDLALFQPNCTLALGRLTFRALCPSAATVDEDGTSAWQLSNFRGSILDGTHSGILPQGHAKVIPTYHPAYCLRAYSDLPYLRWDIARAKRHAAYPELRLPLRNLSIKPTFSEVVALLEEIIRTKTTTAFDVEGYANHIGVTMLSIAKSPHECTVIPLYDNGEHYWSEEEEAILWGLLSRWLSDPTCPKIAQNGAYESFILAWNHGCVVAGIVDDTMFKHWELYPELEKSLGVQTSIYTEEPYYKHERLADQVDTKRYYNAKDSAVTFECSNAQQALLKAQPTSEAHYRFNVSLMPAISYLCLRGCKFDFARAEEHILITSAECEQLMLKIESQLGRSFNVKSTPDKQWLLYEFFDYKPYERYGKTTKEEVLLRYYAKHRHPILKLVIEAISKRTRLSDIGKLTCNTDGRLRCNYNLVGTNTGRLSSSSSSAMYHYFTKTGILKWDFTGTNMQNVTKELRDCFVPDAEELDFWQCDLSGADGWTVAADLAALGHQTMLDDYLAGIRPAKVLLLMLDEHEAGRNPASINQLDRAELKLRTKAIKFPDGRDALGRQADWKYLCMKRVQHGTNYGMEPEKLSATIFKDSDGTIDLSTKDAGLYQYLYKLRYNPTARTQWITRQLAEKGRLVTASGINRQFFGIRNKSAPEPDVVREALSFEPQANTTYATNRALFNLWHDPKNRSSKDSLFVEPLIQVHDALAGQSKRTHQAFATDKLRQWFKTEMIIHGIKLTIPFEGGFGPNWKNTKEVEI